MPQCPYTFRKVPIHTPSAQHCMLERTLQSIHIAKCGPLSASNMSRESQCSCRFIAGNQEARLCVCIFWCSIYSIWVLSGVKIETAGLELFVTKCQELHHPNMWWWLRIDELQTIVSNMESLDAMRVANSQSMQAYSYTGPEWSRSDNPLGTASVLWGTRHHV